MLFMSPLTSLGDCRQPEWLSPCIPIPGSCEWSPPGASNSEKRRHPHTPFPPEGDFWGCLSQSKIDGVPSAQPDIAPIDQLPDLAFQLTLAFNAGRRSVDLDHPVRTMATNANLALAEVCTQDFLILRLRCAVTLFRLAISFFLHEG